MQSFKVEDWVVNTTTDDYYEGKRNWFQLKEDHLIFKKEVNRIEWEQNFAFVNKHEIWEPKTDEWCWFIAPHCAPILAKFVDREYKKLWINNDYKSVKGYKADKFGHYSGNIGPQKDDYIFPYCEPFIGQLPSHLKDNT